jgi:hypothetical protein
MPGPQLKICQVKQAAAALRSQQQGTEPFARRVHVHVVTNNTFPEEISLSHLLPISVYPAQ